MANTAGASVAGALAASALGPENMPLFAVGFTGIVTLVYVILSRKDYPGPTKVFGILAMVGALVLPLVGDTPDTPPVNAPPVLGIFWSA